MKRNENIKHNYFKTWSNNMAYILGFICADGCINLDTRKNGRYGRIYFSIHKNDRKLLEEIAIELGCSIKQVHDRKKEASSYLYVYSTEMYDDLVSLGLTSNKSLTLQWLDIPDEYLKDFIRGYYDGDGSITEVQQTLNYYKLVIQFLGTENFLKGIVNTFQNKLHIIDTGKKIEKTQTRIHCLRYRTKQARNILLWLYEDCELKLDRKYNKFQNHLNRKKVQRLSASSEVNRKK